MLYGRPPFSALSTIQKLQAIPNPKYTIPYPSHEDEYAIETVKACLQRDPLARPCIRGPKGLLLMKFLSLKDSKPEKNQETSICESDKSTFPPLSFIQCQKLVSLVVSALPGLRPIAAPLDVISETVMNLLKDPLNIPQESTPNVVDKPLISMLSKPPLRVSSVSKCSDTAIDSSVENKRPFQNSSSINVANSNDTSNTKKPFASLPASSLSLQILAGANKLKSVSSSNSSRYMGAKKSPEKNMQAVLEKRLQQMRLVFVIIIF